MPGSSPQCRSEGAQPPDIPGGLRAQQRPTCTNPRIRSQECKSYWNNTSGLQWQALKCLPGTTASSGMTNVWPGFPGSRVPSFFSWIFKHQLCARQPTQCWEFCSKQTILPTADVLNDLRHFLTHPLWASVPAASGQRLRARKAPGVPKMASLQVGPRLWGVDRRRCTGGQAVLAPSLLLPAHTRVDSLASTVALQLTSCDSQRLSFLIHNVSTNQAHGVVTRIHEMMHLQHSGDTCTGELHPCCVLLCLLLSLLLTRQCSWARFSACSQGCHTD